MTWGQWGQDGDHGDNMINMLQPFAISLHVHVHACMHVCMCVYGDTPHDPRYAQYPCPHLLPPQGWGAQISKNEIKLE